MRRSRSLQMRLGLAYGCCGQQRFPQSLQKEMQQQGRRNGRIIRCSRLLSLAAINSRTHVCAVLLMLLPQLFVAGAFVSAVGLCSFIIMNFTDAELQAFKSTWSSRLRNSSMSMCYISQAFPLQVEQPEQRALCKWVRPWTYAESCHDQAGRHAQSSADVDVTPFKIASIKAAQLIPDPAQICSDCYSFFDSLRLQKKCFDEGDAANSEEGLAS